MRNLVPRHDEPTAADLAAIETEEPLIDAELSWFAAEIALLNAEDRGGATALDWRRLRRAEARVIRETCAYLATHIEPTPRLAA